MNLDDERVASPVVNAVRSAFARADAKEIARLVEASPVEVWGGLAPDELREVLGSVPARMLRSGGIARVYRAMLNPDDDDPAQRSESSLGDVGDQFGAVLDLRLRGRPVTAAKIMDRASPPGSATPLFDTTAGFVAFAEMQRGVTYMLAGRLDDALRAFSAAMVSPLAGPLMWLLRDAYLKSALVHGLFGRAEEARRALDIADGIPLTQSWLEPGITAHGDIARALIADDEEVLDAIAHIERIPSFVVGELWPFWLLALFQLDLRAGRIEEGLERAERYSAETIASSSGEGFAGSALGIIRGAAALVGGNAAGARSALKTADSSLPLVRILSAAAAIQTDGVEQVAASLVGLSGVTKGLDQLDALRMVVLAWAVLSLGHEATARELLEELRDKRVRVFFVPAVVEEFARKQVPGWTGGQVLLGSAAPGAPVLSKREREVLRMLASDRTRTQIAEELFVSVNTVKSQINSIFRKLGVRTRLDAVMEAARLRLL